MGLGLVGGDAQLFQQGPCLGQGLFAPGESLDALGTGETEPDRQWCQAPVGVVGPKRQTEFGARGEHAIGFADAVACEIVDHDAEIGVGPGDRDRL